MERANGINWNDFNVTFKSLKDTVDTVKLNTDTLLKPRKIFPELTEQLLILQNYKNYVEKYMKKVIGLYPVQKAPPQINNHAFGTIFTIFEKVYGVNNKLETDLNTTIQSFKKGNKLANSCKLFFNKAVQSILKSASNSKEETLGDNKAEDTIAAAAAEAANKTNPDANDFIVVLVATVSAAAAAKVAVEAFVKAGQAYNTGNKKEKKALGLFASKAKRLAIDVTKYTIAVANDVNRVATQLFVNVANETEKIQNAASNLFNNLMKEKFDKFKLDELDEYDKYIKILVESTADVAKMDTLKVPFIAAAKAAATEAAAAAAAAAATARRRRGQRR